MSEHILVLTETARRRGVVQAVVGWNRPMREFRGRVTCIAQPGGEERVAEYATADYRSLQDAVQDHGVDMSTFVRIALEREVEGADAWDRKHDWHDGNASTR